MFSEKRPKKTKPFLKWAGGKRWFVTNHSYLIPKHYNRYIEPFLGSGAVFFHLQPSVALLGDWNKELINTYLAIKSKWENVYLHLQEHHRNHSKEYYYKIRSSCPNDLAVSAARFIYLNRTCWNGLYRVNMSGLFNVPIGTRSSVVFDDDDFEQVSRLLQNATLYDSDFEKLVNMAEEEDLIFVDPPYTVRHNHNAFVRYNEKLFSWSDQERLYIALKRARDRGAKIVGTNAYHQSVREFYEESFSTIVAKRNSSISSRAETRNRFEELIFYTE
jgi:DNA adenine methylase